MTKANMPVITRPSGVAMTTPRTGMWTAENQHITFTDQNLDAPALAVLRKDEV